MVKHSQILSYNVVVKNPQALINYLIDTFSREGDWVLDLFSGSGKKNLILHMKAYFNFYCVFSYLIFF